MRSQVQSKALKDAQVFQNSADHVAVSTFGHYGRHKLNAKEWFFLGKYLLMLLRCASRNKAGGLANCLKMLDPETELLARPLTGLGFEMLPPEERAAFLSSVGKLILAGPERLEDAAASVSLKGESLRQGWPLLPLQISNIVRALPQQLRSRRSNGKTRDSKPTTPQSVAYKWARLNRRMQQIS